MNILVRLKDVKKYRKNDLVKNILSMSLIQGINYIVPFITIPYIARVLTADNFGLVTYAQTFVAYTTLIINFSFDYTVTREIAINKNRSEKLSRIFSTVIFAKILLFIASSISYFSIVLLLPKLRQELVLYTVTYLVNIGFIFFPSWLYQGMGKLSYLAFFNFIVKLLFAIIIFIFVRERSDYLIVPLSTSIGQIVAGIASFIFALRYFKVRIKRVPFKRIVLQLKKSVSVFVAYVAINLYTTANLLILGFFHSDKELGLYSAANKLVVMGTSVIMLPIGLTLFPHIGVKINEQLEEGLALIRKSLKIIVVITALVSVCLFVFAEHIIILVFGEAYANTIPLLKIMSVVPLIVGVSNILGIQAMLNLKMDKQFLNITIQGALLCLILNFAFVPTYGAYASAIGWTITELYITCGFYLLLKKNNIHIFNSPTHI